MVPTYALERPVLLFSGHCHVCRWAARVVARVDRRDELALLPLDHQKADTLLSSIPVERRSDSWWLVLRDGSPLRGDRTGVLLLLIALWIARPVGRVPNSLRVSSFLNTLNETLADYRGQPRPSAPTRVTPRNQGVGLGDALGESRRGVSGEA